MKASAIKISKEPTKCRKSLAKELYTTAYAVTSYFPNQHVRVIVGIAPLITWFAGLPELELQ